MGRALGRACLATDRVIAQQLPVAVLLRVTACRMPSGYGFAKPAKMLASRVIRRLL